MLKATMYRIRCEIFPVDFKVTHLFSGWGVSAHNILETLLGTVPISLW